MPVSNPGETLCPERIPCGGTTEVTVCVHAVPGTQGRTADTVLILDRSGSMCGRPLENTRKAAADLITALAEASGDPAGKTLEGGSRMGLICFSTEAEVRVPLVTDTRPLRKAVQTLEAWGDTNHEKAFRMAGSLLEGSGADRKIVILFTDGVSNLGSADPAARELRESGAEIYCIGLLEKPCLLLRWASEPKQAHVAVTADPEQLDRVFRQIAAEILRGNSLGGRIEGQLSGPFRLGRIHSPVAGTVEKKGKNGFVWDLGQLRCPGDLCLTFEAIHCGCTGGTLPVHSRMQYRDPRGCCLDFPEALVTVDCGDQALVVEPCPKPREITAEGCQDVAAACVGEVGLTGLGRIVEVSAVVRSVCPGKRVAVAVILTEQDCRGNEYARGTKMVMIPPQEGTGCRDVALQCMRFVVPEVLREDCAGDSICADRHFRVRMFANYVDTDFQCCDSETEIL